MSICNGGTKNRVDQRHEINVNKKDLDQKNTSDVEVSSSKSRNYKCSFIGLTDMWFGADVTGSLWLQFRLVGAALSMGPNRVILIK